MQEKQLNREEIYKVRLFRFIGEIMCLLQVKATVTKNDQNWRISYNTDEGNVFGDFFYRLEGRWQQ